LLAAVGLNQQIAVKGDQNTAQRGSAVQESSIRNSRCAIFLSSKDIYAITP
jgi:hypothetical protein